MSEVTRVLMAEDSDRDAELVLHELKRSGLKFESRRVQTEADFRRMLDEFRPQLILSDFVMPGFGGVAALRICREAGIDIPFIFVSGTIGEDVAVEAMKAGADDYVMKTNLIRLAPTVARALREAEVRQGGKVTEAALLRAQAMAKLAHVVTAPDGAFESWSDTLPQLLGIPAAQVPKSTRAWLDLIHPEDRASFRAEAIEAGRTARQIEFEYRLKRADGSWMHIRQVSEPMGTATDASGRLRWFGTLQDVTERKRADRVLLLEHGVARQLADANTATGGLQAAMQLVCESEGWDFGRYWRVDQAAGLLRFGYSWSVPGADGEDAAERSSEVVFAPGDGLAGKVWQSGEPLWVANVSEDARVLRKNLARSTGTRGAFVFPVAAEGETIGVLTFSSRKIRQPDERLLAAVKVIGGQIGQFLRRKEANEKVRRLSRVHAVLSGINGLIVRVRDRDELFREACRIAVEAGNFSAAWMGVLDRAAMEMLPAASHGMPDSYMEAIRDSLSKVRTGGGGIAGEAIRERQPVISNDIANDPRVLIAKKTMALGTQSLAVLPFLSGDELVGVLSLHARETGFFDAEEMKLLQDLAGNIAFAIDNLEQADRLQVEAAERMRAEVKVARLNRVYAVLSGINATIVRVQSREELFKEACRIAVEAGGFKLAWLGIVDRQAARINLAAWHGAGEGYVELMPLRLGDTDAGRRSLSVQAMTERKAMISDDMTRDPRIKLQKESLERGFHSLAVLPLVVAGETEAVLALYAGEVGFFDDEEMKLLHELAGDIAFALDHIEKKEKLDYLAYYDQLTGLANRTLFHERLSQHLSAAQAAGGKLAVVVADIERFRMINDSLGRQAGDALLKEIANRLALAVGRSDVARIGSDHFAVVLPEVKGRSEIGRVVEELWRSCLDQPFMLNGTEVRIALKGGIALYPNDGASADALFRTAEAAWKKAKQTGERYLFHAPEMTARIAEKLTLENKLRQALEKEEFVLHYQPKVDLDARSIVGVEALIRWKSPERGLVPPGLFIPLLEETGLILQAGEWALKRATQDHARWLREGVAAPRIAVNVSAIQLRQRDFVEVVKRAIAGGADPTAIDVEITESLLMENVADNIEKLKALRDLGMKLSIDDFGTGYSSLGYLAKLPVHVLKIDRSFIITMLNDPDTMTLVSTIISLAHSLRLTVVAEGVEQEDQAKMLRLLRCDQMQGYLFSKPLPFEELTPLLRDKR